MNNTLEKLPEDIQRIIFGYAYKCKREQNFYINKELMSMILKQLEKCDNIKVFNMSLCGKCDSMAFDWFSYMGCALF